MLVGSGACFPENCLKNCAVWCILVHSSANFSLHYFAIFEVNLFNVAFADKSENDQKKNLKVLKAILISAGTVLIPFWLHRKKIQLNLNFWPISKISALS